MGNRLKSLRSLLKFKISVKNLKLCFYLIPVPIKVFLLNFIRIHFNLDEEEKVYKYISYWQCLRQKTDLYCKFSLAENLISEILSLLINSNYEFPT